MVQRLRKRPRADTLTNQVRRARGGYGRYVYLSLLIALLLGMLNYAFGDRVLLRADGMVLRDRVVVAATSLVRIERVRVRTGDLVAHGDVLFEISSAELVNRIADLAAREADLALRQSDLVTRSLLVTAISENAERRVVEADKLVELAEKANAGDLFSQERLVAALEARHEALTEATRLQSEAQLLGTATEVLEAARSATRSAKTRLGTHYSDGLVRSPADGAVDVDIPVEGEVFRPGEPILSLLTGEPYVLAYLPENYLFGIGPGTAVNVSSGPLTARGRIDEILPLSAEIPKPFQTAFRVGQRRQLARIVIEEGPPLPITATVRVSTRNSPDHWLASVWTVFAAWAKT